MLPTLKRCHSLLCQRYPGVAMKRLLKFYNLWNGLRFFFLCSFYLVDSCIHGSNWPVVNWHVTWICFFFKYKVVKCYLRLQVENRKSLIVSPSSKNSWNVYVFCRILHFFFLFILVKSRSSITLVYIQNVCFSQFHTSLNYRCKSFMYAW